MDFQARQAWRGAAGSHWTERSEGRGRAAASPGTRVGL